MKRGPSAAGSFDPLFFELVDCPLFLLKKLVRVRAIVLLGVGGVCRLGLGWALASGGCSRLFFGMLAIAGGRLDL